MTDSPSSSPTSTVGRDLRRRGRRAVRFAAFAVGVLAGTLATRKIYRARRSAAGQLRRVRRRISDHRSGLTATR